MDEQQEGKSNPPTPLEASELKQIRTYQGDIANALEKQNESIFSIHQTEVEKRRMNSPSQNVDADKSRKDLAFLFFGGVTLLAIGVMGAWLGYREYARRSAPPTLSVPESRLVSATSEVTIDLTGVNRDGFARTFAENILTTSSGELRHVVVVKKVGEETRIIQTDEFLTILESQAPGSLTRALHPIFMLGSLGNSPFVIIPLNSFENAYAGMLAWENSLTRDLLPIFSNPELLKAVDSPNVFKDVIVRNKDVRVLSVGEGTSTQDVLMYSFFDNNKLIITESIDALQTLIDRLTRERLSR